MRLPSLSNSKASFVEYSLRSAALAALLAMGVGCEVKSFLDPSEVGRYERQPLALKILDTLDTGEEEPNTEFLNATDPTPEDLVTTRVDYKMDRGDLVSVSISDLQTQGVDTVRTVRVSESGNISLPYIGQLKALGLTEAELEANVIEAYRAANLIQNAQVAVTVAEARGRAFSILGAISAPGQYAIIQSDFRVLDALVLARDTTSPTLDYIYVIRKKSVDAAEAPAATQPAPATGPAPDALEPRTDATILSPVANRPVLLQAESEAAANQPATTVPTDGSGGRYITIDGKQVLIQGGNIDAAPVEPATQEAADATTKPFEFNDLPEMADQRIIRIPLPELRQGELKYNIVIKPQDMIVVPNPVVGEYYMGGHVSRVGVYSLTGRKITLKQAVVSAGMLDGLAIPQRTNIVRRVGKNREVFARVDLAKIFEGAAPDVYLKPDDVVQVGTNFFAPFLAAVRGGFRMTYGFGFLYDRNYAPDNDDN